MKKLIITFLFPIFVYPQGWNTELVGNFEYSQILNDIWGYRAVNGNEYALVGTVTGTSIVDVTTNPSEPEEVAFIPGLESLWRDIKTYQNYMYVSTEAQQGIQVVDLSSPEEAVLVETWDGENNEGVSAHNIFQTDGYLYVIGTDTSFGDMHILDLSNPAAPVLVGTWSGEYLHDVYVRENYAYGAGIYSSTMYIIDISDKSNPTTVTSWTYPGKAHACWLTEDGNYLITADEISGGHVKIWDISDFNNINMVSEWMAADAEDFTVHNVFVRENYLYCSYYAFGLQIVDISDPYNPTLAGYYDTYLDSSELFEGVWGVYPFTNNCNVYVSDRSNGLFVVDFPGCVNLGSIIEPPNPKTFLLHSGYPNPFNPITSLRYDLSEQAQVTLTIYDLMGREITQLVNTTQEAGYKSVQWNATDTFGKPVSAGVYLYQIRAGEFVQTRKMVLLK